MVKITARCKKTNLPGTMTFDQFDSKVSKSRAFESEAAAKKYAKKTGGKLYTQVDGDGGDRVYMKNPDRFYNKTGRFEVITDCG